MNDIQSKQNSKQILESHHSKNMKVNDISNIVAVAPQRIPKHHLFNREEADKRFNSINLDIYEGTQQKKSEQDFKKSLYLKIFGGVALATGCIAGIDKIKDFFRKS